MPSDRFTAFLPFIFEWECVKDRKGNVIPENVAGDSGGVTKWGIDKSGHPSLSVDFIKNMIAEQATAIYWQEWQKDGCERYPFGLGEAFFNCAVNCGIGRANKILAKGVRTGEDFVKAQEDFYKRLAAAKPTLGKFLKGWENRTAALLTWIKEKEGV